MSKGGSESEIEIYPFCTLFEILKINMNEIPVNTEKFYRWKSGEIKIIPGKILTSAELQNVTSVDTLVTGTGGFLLVF
jgi:hypothetical protein